MKTRLSPFKPLFLPVLLLILFTGLAFNYRLFPWFDDTVTDLIRKLPASTKDLQEDISVLGNFYENIIIILILVFWQLLRKHYNRAIIAGLSLLAFPLFFLVKETVSRARPAGEFVIASGLPGFSFPSGHAVTSATAFGLLAILAYSHLKAPWKYIVFAACLILVGIIGITRVYLGAHFPTDVIGGWLLAFLVLSSLRGLSIYIASRTTRKVSSTTEDPAGVK